MSLLHVNNLTLRFGGLTAVNGVNFHVAENQVFSLIGPNGAGKTTVFNAITGIYDPTEGHILFQGRRVRRLFSAATFGRMLFAGMLGACALLLAVNIEFLWGKTIIANYIYQQPFSWPKAAHSFAIALREAGLKWTLLPAAIGAVIGGAGTWAVWQRARRTPDVVAARGISRTFQNIRLFPEMTAVENVLVGMDTRLRTRAWHAAFRLPFYWKEQRSSCQNALDILAFVDLEEHADTVSSALAYGHQRRLEIARALAASPRLLLLDEPAAGMNPSETVELMDLIRKIKERGVSVLLIEHDMKVVMGVSDRIAVLDYGNKIAEGTPEEVRRDPKVMAAYLGAPATA